MSNLILRICISYYFLRNHPRHSFRGTGPLFLAPGFSLSSHWSRVRDDFCENFKDDILWLIVLRGIKVRDSLARWGYINVAPPALFAEDARPSTIAS